MDTRASLDDYPPVMDSTDVDELLGYRATQIRIMAQQGRIPAHREPGPRQRRFNRDELIAWLKSEARVRPDAE
jgi:excisionase family DNA binding protein